MPKVELQDDGSVWFWCPGCTEPHRVMVGSGSGPRWTYTGGVESPTFAPSVRVRCRNADGPTVCHSFVRQGRIEFLGDCTHALAGQTVELPEFTWDP